MDDPVCASCHRGLSLEEIERGSFKQLGGRIYCADCLAKMRRVGPTVCPHCGAHDTPLYNGSAYVCRKCGGQLERRTAPAPAAPSTRKRPSKKCPYCGATLPAESLKCRYCGSSLTREASDLNALTRQNLRLRFWLGCLLTASVFLACLLAYLLVGRPPAAQQARAADPTSAAPAHPAPATADGSTQLADKVEELQRRLAGLQTQLAEARRTAVAVAPPEPGPEVTPTPPKPSPPKPATATPRPTPPKPTPPKPAPTKPDPAKLAAEAYPALEKRLAELKGERRYAEAIAACRQFVAAHLGTAHGDRAAEAQKALQSEVDGLRDQHIARFRKALSAGDLKAARAVAAELGRYKAPQFRDDRARMLAEVLAAEQQPQRDRARYLAGPKAPPAIQRLIAQLAQRDDPSARAAAARELGRHRHAAATGPLINAVQDPDWYVANLVIKALAEIGDPIALPDVARRTKALHPGVYAPAAQAARTLAAADRKEHAEAWKLVDTKAVAADIVEALTKIPKEESRVTSGFRIDLIETLVLLDAKEAVPALRSFLKTQDKAVRVAAEAAVGKLTGKTDIVAKAPPKPPPPEKPAPPEKPEKTGTAGPKPAPTAVKAPKPQPAETPKPAPKPKAKPKPPAAPPPLTGTIEAHPDGSKAIPIRLPARHGLAKGDTVELTTGGRPLCVCQIAQANGTRVLATIVKLLDKTPPAADTQVTLTRTK